jgi:hypothetical protein
MEQNKEQTNDDKNDKNDNYIWFGVYNELLLNQNILNTLKKCNDKSLPKLSASIHLNKYTISFNKNQIFIRYKENSSIFIKLYLITKTQLIDILKNDYNCNDKILNETEKIWKMQKIDEGVDLDQYQGETNFYNSLKLIGVFNKINIYAITSKNNLIDLHPPDKDYLNIIYDGLKKSFYLYSDYLIMYYLYLIHEIKTTYNLQKLTEIFFGNKNLSKDEDKKDSNVIIKEVDNQKQLWYFLPKNEIKEKGKGEDINEYNYILDAASLPEFDETTGEFFWNNNDANWEKVNQKIKSNEEIKNKVVNVENGSMIKLLEEHKGEKKNNENASENNKNTQKKNTLRYIEELSNILDTK